jgi:hypothetical protein
VRERERRKTYQEKWQDMLAQVSELLPRILLISIVWKTVDIDFLLSKPPPLKCIAKPPR